MIPPLSGLHHVTAIASDPQRNVDLYTGLLGLRLVKVTVDVDDPEAYHLYYGDEVGRPGTLLTFYCWPGAIRGRPGTGQTVVTAPGCAPGYASRLAPSPHRPRPAGRGAGPARCRAGPLRASEVEHPPPESQPLFPIWLDPAPRWGR